MKSKILVVCILALSILAGCKKDNKEAPGARITGRVVYNGQPINVRTNGVQLELWQSGYQLFTKIPVYVNQDGTFSAAVFDGAYKLTRLKGNGPWVDNTDTISVQVKGSSSIDVPVTPYFIIKNESFQRNGSTLTATCKVDQIVASKAIERATFYIGATQFVDATNNADKADLTGTALSDLSQPLSFSRAVPAALASKDYVFVRIGVKAMGVSELIYTPVQKVALK